MLEFENLYKTFGDKTLFNHISGVIRSNDRIGLIGVNGTGKSTFLKAIAGIEPAESGSIQHSKNYHIQYLAQSPELDPELTVMEGIYYGDAMIMKVMRDYERALLKLENAPGDERLQAKLLERQQEMDENEAWEANTVAKTILSKLGINNTDEKIGRLSGGQQKRVAIANALIQPADLLILDEPTNHLDNETVQWLETYLAGYKGALLLVTHDRYFLNRVTNRIYELDKGNLYMYEGNYELFLEKKAEREELERANEQKHSNTLRRELAWLKRGAKARSTKQKARIGRVKEMQQETFDTNKEAVAFEVGTTRLGKKVLEIEHISKSFSGNPLIHDFNRLIIPGDRIGIVGPNGSGKTSLLQMLAGRLTPDSGTIETGETVKIGYYTQNEEEIDGELKVIDYIKEIAEVIHTADDKVITAEQMLERFLFPRPQQWTYIRRLSGGEKRRLYLLKVLMTEPNVLFLDEPTNDLDTQTLGVLEEYLQQFPGVIVTVSHDRYFLDRVVDELLIFKGAGVIDSFYGNYTEWLETIRQTPNETDKDKKKQAEKVQQQPKKKKLSYKDQKEWEEIEDLIAGLEGKIAELQENIAAAGSDLEKVQSYFAEQQELEKKLEEKMERWEELSLLVEEIENQ
ncbi:ABC-F family ATP-binding cassette domain-containing protein [Virgibacillus halophilus]|uniref:ABC-F family ATP-binding cassette domain-containing protein n=1 Tax=Tigheibacillus halophilus TaxID=361280 RepID=UPI003625C72A